MDALNRSFEVFEESKDKLLDECPGSFVVVVGDKIQDKRYSSFKEALEETIKEHRLGTFIIQHVVDDKANFSLI